MCWRTQRPPRPTLFPYTSLFRSRRFEDQLRVPRGKEVARAIVVTGVLGYIAKGIALVGVGDRKSTRLNSSHVAISYAVFCLNKKSQDKYWTSRNQEQARCVINQS